MDALKTEMEAISAEVERALAAMAADTPASGAATAERGKPPGGTGASRRRGARARSEPPSDDGTWERCQIDWWQGGRRGGFDAQATRPEGRPYVAGRSPIVQWEGTDPPPEAGTIVAAHDTLVAKLLREGWEPEGGGDTWYGRRFRRRPEPSEPGGRRVILTIDLADSARPPDAPNR